MTWRQCLNARGAADASTAAGALRRARQEGRAFDVLLSEGVPLGAGLTVIVRWTSGAAS
jgi:hypothetical protein